jgi:hypothetical protein
MYKLETKEKILSLHLSLNTARDALCVYNSRDRTGTLAYVTKVPVADVAYAVGTLVVFAGIGVLLAL